VKQSPPVWSSEGAAGALSSEDIESLLGALSKSLRAYQMYQSNNPVFQRFHEALREELLRLWSKTDAVELTVQEDGFGYGGAMFGVGGGRDSLAFTFYKDGVRYLKFMPGFEEEVGAFLDAVRRARLRDDDANDMISVLWEEDFTSFHYGYVDLLSEGMDLPDGPLAGSGLLAGAPLPPETLELEDLPSELEGVDGSGALAGGLTRAQFDDTLYFLDPSELESLRTEVETELERDLRRDVVNAMLDRLEDAPAVERATELLGILDQLLPLFLSRGDLANAARILEELGGLAGRGVGGPELADRVDQLFRRLSDSEVLEQFVAALDEGAILPEAEQVAMFFSRLHGAALPVLIRFAESSGTSAVRAPLASAVDGLAARHPEILEELLRSEDVVLVRGAARAAGRVRLGQVARALHAALSHQDRDVRLAAVGALAEIRSGGSLQALIPALDDRDREVRIAAARALGAVRFDAARDALAAAVAGGRMKGADLTERMAFFEAYGAVGGPAAVTRLSRLLHGRGFLKRRASPEIRACAALGLGRAGTGDARAILERHYRDEDPVVRNAVIRALEGEPGT
jgi:HEAT repeat protein